ncbi:hypothetical protein D5F51_18495 [Yersinia hibernica]|uniref:Uncharacterized protein n=1 Tax=Yersinia hibernica TaxID=2339259 RepID=A0ABX5R4W5_9GAMM|nr:hypothetical protein D5F51_18495 [Yersinia hibernica]
MVIMIGSYTFGSALYMSMFGVTSHRSVGMIFISFYFLLIASPVLFVTLFVEFRIGLAILFFGICYLFFEWYSLHPLRVILMAGSVVNGYVFIFSTRKYGVWEK